MLTAGTTYILLFTVFNIYIAMYLRSSVKTFKNSGKLPRWAIKSRNFLDNLDDTIKDEDIEKINAGIVEAFTTGGWMKLFESETYSSMDFLQIKANADNTYEVRDDYELKRAMKSREAKQSKPKPMESDDESKGEIDTESQGEKASINDPNTIVEALFNASLDINDIDKEKADKDSNAYKDDKDYRKQEKMLKESKQTMNELKIVTDYVEE